MRENEEDWKAQLDNVTIEIRGLQEITSLDFLILISKLEGLRNSEIDFHTYRRTVFKIIELLCEVTNYNE